MPYKDITQKRTYDKNWRIRMREERRCTKCGVYLVEEEKLCCVNCNMHLHRKTVKGVLRYAIID